MKPFIFIIIIFFSSELKSQTVLTLGFSGSTMLVSPSAFKIEGLAFAPGGFMKAYWQSRNSGYKYVEAGAEFFKYRDTKTRKDFAWNYLRLFLGKRVYTNGHYGYYMDIAGGFMGVLPMNLYSDKIYLGAGVGFGTGYSSQAASIGIAVNTSLSSYGIAFNPMLQIGLNIGKSVKSTE